VKAALDVLGLENWEPVPIHRWRRRGERSASRGPWASGQEHVGRWRVGVEGVQSDGRPGILAARGAAGSADVLVNLVRAVVHDPDVANIARVDGDAGRMSVGWVDGPAAQ
jgi:hypothetical protein